jgi:hypothetical protein
LEEGIRGRDNSSGRQEMEGRRRSMWNGRRDVARGMKGRAKQARQGQSLKSKWAREEGKASGEEESGGRGSGGEAAVGLGGGYVLE